MTLEDLQDKLQVLYDNDISTPDSSDEEYETRTALFNTALSIWEKEEQWRELLVSSDSFTSPIVTVISQADYELPTDFVRIAGYVRTSDGTTYTYIPQKDPSAIQLYDNDSSTPFFYINGNPKDSYYINLHPAPTVAGLELKFEYYKHPTDYSTSTDVSEIPDPLFLVYFALSKLFDADGASAKSQKAYMEMASRLDNMVQQNMLQGWFQDTSIPDVDTINGCRGFGF